MAHSKKAKQEILRVGMDTDFWRVLIEGIQANIEELRKKNDDEEFRNLPANQYKLENELLLAKIKYLEKLIHLPTEMIAWFENPDNTVEDHDPYD